MKTTIFAVLSVAVLLPRVSYAGPIRDVDNSEYGMQATSPCASFSDPTNTATCFSSSFLSNTTHFGFLVGFNSNISDVEVRFANANIYDAGLVTCNTQSDPVIPCNSRPSTWALDLGLPGHDLSLSTSNIADGPLPPLGLVNFSAVFDLNGSFQLTNVQGNRIGILLLCSSGANGPAASDCNGVNISVRSLATAPVPEPASLFLCGTGAAMLARRFRNRRVR